MVPQISGSDKFRFFPMGIYKKYGLRRSTTTRDNIIDRIRNCCNSIPRNVLETARNFEHRIQLCIQNEGGIFEHLLR